MNNQLDLLLVQPGGLEGVYQGLHVARLTAIHTPVEAGLMGSFARKHNLSVIIVDAAALSLSPTQVGQIAANLKPRMAAVFVQGNQVNASTQTMPAATEIARATKNLDPTIAVLLTGHHPAALPSRTLSEEKDVDFVAGGEPYYTVLDLAEALMTHQPNLNKVRGLWWREGDQIVNNPPAPLVEDVDREIGGIAYDLLPPPTVYRAHNWQDLRGGLRSPYAVIQTTWGCPFHCHFCMIQSLFREGERALGYREGRNSYRFLSPKRVVDQLERLVRENGKMLIRIYDEMFVLNPNHVRAICEEIIERGLGQNLKIWAYARIDTTKDWMLALLREAGFEILAFGIESGNAEVREHVDKGFSETAIQQMVERVHAAGLEIVANYIYGLPWDSQATMEQTLSLAKSLRTFWYNGYAAMAYPGSALYQDALKGGWVLPATWGGYSQHALETLPLPTEHLSAGQVLSFRDRAFDAYFKDAGYLAMMEARFGENAVRQIQAMTAISLTRKFAA